MCAGVFRGARHSRPKGRIIRRRRCWNGDGRCDGDEAQARADAAGAWQLSVPRGSPAPLVAEIVAGQSRDPASGTVANVSYRMASPSVAYGTAISPFSTLVHLCRESNLAIAEGLVRNVLGLPRYFDLAAWSSRKSVILTDSGACAGKPSATTVTAGPAPTLRW